MTEALYAALNKPKWIRQDIENLESELNAYTETMKLSGIRYDSDKVKTSPKDYMPEYAARVDSMQSKIKEKQQEYLKAHDAVRELADALQGIEKKIIIQRYLECRRYEDIAAGVYMSVRQMYKYRSRAIEKLEKIVQ